ncbi:MAG TPA: sigma-70 family RNA polymerase sigma factor [Ilumatobacteraceae bacterium]|nr:sigma-70 family RNA polymerase sigma factor [Ilumatobacteraceae bacterium]
MPELRTDAQLVTAYLTGDRSALAGIYDRFSPGLYDTAAAMLRDRHEAADAMQDVFLIAAERLRQLREPERLKPWLYAILRNEVYRRTKKRGRALPTDFSAMGSAAEMAAPNTPDAEGEAVAGAELAELVRAAACGLDERDQLVLELSIRQGLQGADLAAALGVSAEQSYTLVHRMRDRVDRSLGALVVARAGRKDCAELDAILKGWDGEFTVLVRKRVARHVESCTTCDRTKKRVAPIALLGVAPAFAAPPSLRGLILSKAGTPGAAPKHAYKFTADGGFPRMVRRLRIPGAVLGGTLAVLLGIGGGALVVATGDDDGSATTTVPVTTVVATTETTATPTTVEPTTEASTTTPLTPGSLVLSATNVDLGASKNSQALDLFNPGQLPIDWLLDGNAGAFVLTSTGGTLAAGEHLTITVAISRSGRPEGDLSAHLNLDGSDGSVQTLHLKARVEHKPVVTIDQPTGTCTYVAYDTTVGVTISDESAIAQPITLTWSGPTSGSAYMVPDDNLAFGLVHTSYQTGIFSFSVTVSDVRGNTTTVQGKFDMEYCIA